MTPTERMAVELQQYLRILRERWRLAVITVVLVLGAVVAYTLLQTPTYQATNRVFVQTGGGTTVTDLNSGVNFASQQITSYADLATTPLVLQPVVDTLGLSTSPQSLASQISTAVPPETLILEITATSEDPAQAAEIANATSASLRDAVAELEKNSETDTPSVQLTVISPAQEHSSPASPSLLRNATVGVVLALLAGLAAAIIRDLLDNRVRQPEDITRAFKNPVIGSIPASKDAKHLPLISSDKPQSLQAEAYRDLRTNLQFLGLTENRRSVLFTSSLPGEGKSSSAINLAYVLAQAGNRVLLIDADLRRPSVAEYLGLEGGAGLTTVLIGEATLEDVTQPLDVDGLDVLTSGTIPPNPSEILGSSQMKLLLDATTPKYDYVVVDTAPLLAVTDAVVLSQVVGGTVLVAQSERVTRQQLDHSLAKLDAVHTKLLGILLNRVQIGARGNYYSYETHLPRTTNQATMKTAHGKATGPFKAEAHPESGLRSQPRKMQLRLAEQVPGQPGRRRAPNHPAADSPTTQPKSWPGISHGGGTQ